jgi:hypothetical protein
MAFVLRREREFPLALTYQGPEAVLEFEFSFFFPFGADDLAFLLDGALFSIDVLPIIQANYLRYTIESDREPLPDRYRVRLMLAGEVEESQGQLGPFTPFAKVRPQALFAIPPLLVIVTALGIALIFAVIAWRTYTLGLFQGIFGKPKDAIPFLLLGAVGLGLYLVFVRRRNGQRTPN